MYKEWFNLFNEHTFLVWCPAYNDSIKFQIEIWLFIFILTLVGHILLSLYLF